MSRILQSCCSSWLVLSLSVLSSVRAAIPDPTVNWIFNSRPDLSPPRLNVTFSENPTPGYIFMAPYQAAQNAAVIYDLNGDVVWSGYGIAGTGNAHDFRVCTYNGTDHLCVFTGVQFLGYARGIDLILDNTYKVVKSVQSNGGLSALDQHEFKIFNNSAIGIIYHPERYDLSNYMISTGQGWISNCFFQEIDIDTGELLFEWSAIENVGLNETYVMPNSSDVAGSGFDFDSPWDYFHANSVDKNDEGDYLLSARHTSTIYKISGQNGTILWRCGGMMSDFDFEPGLNWSYQHDARWHSYNSTTVILSLYDNGSNGFQSSANQSSSMIIALDLDATPRPYVRLITQIPGAQGFTISASQGNTQLLTATGSNDNSWETSPIFTNGGSQPWVMEHTADGNLTFQANLVIDGQMNYRGFKFNWTANPTNSPSLYTYAQSTDNSTTTFYYMSWNGATEVATWRLYAKSSCSSNNDDGWTLVADSIPKSGFETVYNISGYYELSMVEAVASNGTSLRNSTSKGVTAFVPGVQLASVCSLEGCNNATTYDNGAQVVMAQNLTDAPPVTRTGCPYEYHAASTANSSSSSDSAKKNASTTMTTSFNALLLTLIVTFLALS